MKNLIYIFFFLLLSCSSNNNKKLSYALELAGENRNELENVLKHYQNDPEKFTAARFLIENMPGHNSYHGNDLKSNYDRIDSILLQMMPAKDFRDCRQIQQTIDSITSKFQPQKILVEDIKTIKADYLIKDIDQAFDTWKKQPWCQHVLFDDFCEYILPYKISNFFMLEDWRSNLKKQIDKEVNDKLKTFQYSSEMQNSAYWACCVINEYLKKKINPKRPFNVSPNVYRLSTLVNIPYGVCDDQTIIATAVMRSLGIPIMIDFTFQWPFRSLGHIWNIVLANNGKNIPFSGCDTGPDIIHKPESKMAKVYRETYSMNQELIKLHKETEIVPSAFKNIFMKDVSDEYMKTYNITIPIQWEGKYNYAYLAVFNNKEWVPVCYGKRNKNSFRFEKIGNNIVYLPIYYTSEGIKAFNSPFLLDIKGNIRPIVTKTDSIQKLTLYRKFFISQLKYEYINDFNGSIFQAANQKDFSDAILIYSVNKWSIYNEKIHINTQKKYRYWRYLSPKDGVCDLATLEFYDNNDSIIKGGDIIGTIDPEPPLEGKEVVFDTDPLTYYQVPKDVKSPWVGKDFRKPISIKKISYLPRNDDNNISPNNDYELLYWEKDSWVSLGSKPGTESGYLIYTNVPTDGLYLLKNLTRGSENRIFTYENDQQVWW